jgi:isopenicillin N synthase-like dioxygenase
LVLAESSSGNDESKRCPNVWLEDKYLPGLKTNALDFMTECRALQMKALKALALGMEHVPADFFEDYHTDADDQLRLLHCTSTFLPSPLRMSIERIV